ncbi:hypothetical protein ALC56_08545, partial [Trachymyrmex septentrionalis]
KEVLINNSRWRRIRERVKSIGVMTRGKVEAKYFLSQEENLRLSEIEKEKCVEKRVRIGGGERARSRVRQASRWNKGGGGHESKEEVTSQSFTTKKYLKRRICIVSTKVNPEMFFRVRQNFVKRINKCLDVNSQ